MNIVQGFLFFFGTAVLLAGWIAWDLKFTKKEVHESCAKFDDEMAGYDVPAPRNAVGEVVPITRLNEYDRDEWRGVCRRCNPKMTDEQFEDSWNRFVGYKAQRELH